MSKLHSNQTVHRVMPHTEHDGVITGYFCLDCGDWVIKEHNENLQRTSRRNGKQ